MFNKQRESGSNLCINLKSSEEIFLEDFISEPFFKVPTISDEYKYSNIQIKGLKNITRICIHAISRV